DVRGHADPFRCRHAPPRTRWRPPAADDTPRGPAAPPNRRTGFGFRSAAPPLPRRPDARGGRRRAGGSVAGAARRRRARPRARRRAAPLPGSGPQGATGCRRALLAAAGELLPKRGQGLVGGQRAAGALRAAAGAARGGTRVGVALVGGGRRGGLGLGGLGLLDLLAVRLEAGLRHGVLALPLVALGLEALHPLAGLRVEALGVLVVPLLVVLGGHAVEGRVELLLVRRDALVGLLQREADPAAVEVDVDDLDEDLGADLDDLLGDLHVALGQLGDVHQALDALLDADERAERNQLGDLAGDDLADLVRAGELLPGVFLGGLEGQGDALALHVDVEDLDGDLLPTSTTSLGWSMCFQDSSETCTRPSTPPRSTNAPKLTIEETTPLRIWPFCRVLRKVWRTSDWVCSSQARRDRTTLLRFLSSSMILASRSRPT